MRIIFFGALITLSFFSSPTFSTEYVYRDLMANTLPSVKCESPVKAKATAEKAYKLKIYSKKFCQTQGYGWHVQAIKENGKAECNECTDQQGLQKCHMKDVVLTCKRIKPGTVGMLPGKG
ncbi:MAG: hypothetical protein GQ532_10510 [Methylomarinum sp.]|nr:hypothetical protein [Methylococcales bacterium]NOR70106.1 hypothetical protein [Methylomarinum sp.]